MIMLLGALHDHCVARCPTQASNLGSLRARPVGLDF